MNAQELTRALGGRWHGKHGMVLCPAHADKNPSLAIRDGDSKVLFHCHAGCEQDAVLDGLRAQGVWNSAPSNTASRIEHVETWTPIIPVPADAPRQMPDHPQHGRYSARWLYPPASPRTSAGRRAG